MNPINDKNHVVALHKVPLDITFGCIKIVLLQRTTIAI